MAKGILNVGGGVVSVDASGNFTVETGLIADGASVFNETGVDVDFRIESDDNANMLFVDGGNDRVGIGVATPAAQLEVEQGSTGGVVAFTIDNNDTDKVAMSIEAANIDANVMDITMDAVTTADGINISADGLTTGSALSIDSDSSSNATRNIVEITQNHASATGSTALKVQQDSTGTGSALIVDSESESSAGLTTNGKMAFVSTQDIAGGYAAVFQRNIAEAGSNPLVQFIDNHTSNTQTTLKVQQDGSGAAAVFDGGNVYVRKGSGFQTLTTSSWVMGG